MVESQTKSEPVRKLFYGLFIFPLIIAVGMAVLLCTVVLLTNEAETPESLITDIKTGSPSKRWQKAFELSNELNQGRGMMRESGVMKEIIHILMNKEEYDARTRSFMAAALVHFDSAEADKALQDALGQEEEEDVLLYLIWALGLKDIKGAREQVESFIQHESVEIQKMAVYVLGVFADAESAPLIEPLLSSRERDLRWNAALSLARLGSDAGHQEILIMLDRKTLATYEGLTEAKIEEIMINAIRGIALLHRPEGFKVLANVANDDKSLKVRQAAMEVLKSINTAE